MEVDHGKDTFQMTAQVFDSGHLGGAVFDRDYRST
jgi:hypothetical protein